VEQKKSEKNIRICSEWFDSHKNYIEKKIYFIIDNLTTLRGSFNRRKNNNNQVNGVMLHKYSISRPFIMLSFENVGMEFFKELMTKFCEMIMWCAGKVWIFKKTVLKGY